jgi:phage terminase Nu1 subunit (DNA packaging protein)
MRALAPLEVPASMPAGESIEELNRRLKKAEADKREHEADMARMERETMAGNLIAREDVEFALDDFGATLRSLMENLADRLAPVVHPLQTIEETHAALSEAAQDVLLTMHDLLAQRANERRSA